jgi:multiple sugar transport system substrate-binding protein
LVAASSVGAILSASLAVSGVQQASASTFRHSATAGATSLEVDILAYNTPIETWAKKAMSLWAASHPSFKLNIVVSPVDTLLQTETTRAQAGDPPAISSLTTAWMPAFAQANYLYNIHDLLPASYLNTYNSNLLKANTYTGKLFILPYASSARALYYNKAEFAKAGISSPPQTWAQLEADAAKIVTSGAAKYALSVEGTGSEAYSAWFNYLYWSFGGSYGNSPTAVTLDNRACVSALTVLSTLQKGRELEPNPQTFNADQELTGFESQDAAMTITGPWLQGLIATGFKGLNYGVAPIPAGSTRATLGVTDGWTVYKGTKATKAQLKQALMFLMSPPVENLLLSDEGFLPTQQSGFSSPAYKSGFWPIFDNLLPIAKFAPLAANWDSYSTQAVKVLQNLYVNGASASSVCQGLQGLLSR